MVEAEHGLIYVALSRATTLSQIVIISTITRTRMNSLNKNTKIRPHLEHKTYLLRRSILIEEI